ncbi:hypothetical protein ACFT8Q_34380, partial [Streptomyces griseoincarnatus]
MRGPGGVGAVVPVGCEDGAAGSGPADRSGASGAADRAGEVGLPGAPVPVSVPVPAPTVEVGG